MAHLTSVKDWNAQIVDSPLRSVEYNIFREIQDDSNKATRAPRTRDKDDQEQLPVLWPEPSL